MLLKIFTYLSCFYSLSFAYGQDTIQKIIPRRFNSPEQLQKPYVILISADGFRYDFAEKYHAENLLRLREKGVTAAFMQPSYPSVTFSNHYSIITGLYPSHHGIVDNSFYDKKRKTFYSMYSSKKVTDGSWYGGVPLWVLAEKQKMLTASFYWVGSEADINGIKPTYYYKYNEAIPIERRIQLVKEWLQLPENRRPHFITFYFPQVDHEAHDYGPESEETKKAVLLVDSAVGKLAEVISELNLPVNFIFVSDHGMTKVDIAKKITLPVALDTTKFIVYPGSAIAHLYAKNKKDIEPAFAALKKEAKDYDVYLPEGLPDGWHYGDNDDWYGRAGDIVLVPHHPAYFNFTAKDNPSIGRHGYDISLPDMYASFFAWGPAFKPGIKIEGFENVHVFPLIADILGLNYSHKIDGRLEVLQPVLKPNKHGFF